MLFPALFWSVIAGFLEMLLLASGYVFSAIAMYLAVALGVFYLGKVSAIEGDE